MAVREELWGVEVQVVAVRSEVVVDDVEQDHETASVRRGDQALEPLRPAVGCIGCERQHAVIAPAAAPGKIGDRHQLERGDPQLRQIVEPRFDPGERAFGREGADVQLVDRGFLPRAAAPAAVFPLEVSRIHDFAGAVHVVGIEPRGRIGHRALAIDQVAVTRGVGRGRYPFPPAVAQRLHVQTAFVWTTWRNDKRDLPRRGGPEPEAGAPRFDHLGAKGHAVHAFHLIGTTQFEDLPPRCFEPRSRWEFVEMPSSVLKDTTRCRRNSDIPGGFLYCETRMRFRNVGKLHLAARLGFRTEFAPEG